MPAHRAPASDTGFVLVGVVVFVLALTILVLSLYGLSSYEAQFLQRSLDEEQSFQSAVGGIERAKYALTRTSQLPSVKNGMPADVIASVAIQVKGSVADSTGSVDWLGSDVTIRVTARVNGARRTVEGRFSPLVTQSYYSSLVTVSGGIEVVPTSPMPPPDRYRTVLLDGWIWESSGQSPNTWKTNLYQPGPDSIRQNLAVPVPDVAPYLDPSGLVSTAPLATEFQPTVHNLTCILDASVPPGVPGYFRSDNDPYKDFSFNSYPYPPRDSVNTCTIQVHGLAVWLLPHGAMFYENTFITGNPATDCLVIIAGPGSGGFGPSNADRPTSSICFLGSLQAFIPVVLVSSGEVLMYHENDWYRNTDASDLAIFARSVRFMGPSALPPTNGMLTLHRDPTGPLNTPQGMNPSFLDALAGQGALPNANSVAGRRLDLVSGTWHASDR